jgi:hypothetical protein
MKTGLGSAVATIALALLALLTGCDAATPIQPGLAAVRIEVIARPKAGYHPPADSSYGSSASGDDRYVPVDYTRLENVIVWLEPEGQAIASDAAARATRIRLVRPRSRAALPWYVACANAPVILQNANSSPDHFYSVSEGNNFDTGELGSSGEATVVIHAVADREPQRSREASSLHRRPGQRARGVGRPSRSPTCRPAASAPSVGTRGCQAPSSALCFHRIR